MTSDKLLEASEVLDWMATSLSSDMADQKDIENALIVRAAQSLCVELAYKLAGDEIAPAARPCDRPGEADQGGA